MEESWEEKTERLEREYQARIDRLREELDCGQDGPCAKSPGCNRHWEERNRELVQRVAELENEKAEADEHSEELAANYERTKLALRVTKQQRDELALRGALPVVERLERMAEAHRKAQDSAAEVFSQAAYAIVSLENDLTALRTQLEWTPVSAGLPTEPGVYEFKYTVHRLDDSTPFRIPNADGVPGSRNYYTQEMADFGGHYRRVELPKDGES